MIWFTSDTHYWHQAVIGFCNRPFSSLEEMHEELIKRYNSRVSPEDTCIFVGDFSFGNSDQTESILKRLNGTKILIIGNHDKRTTINKFDLSVLETKLQISGYLVTVKHYPLRWPPYTKLFEKLKRLITRRKNPRYLERMPFDYGQLHIHGHTHARQRFRGNQIHVGVDAWDYYPVSIKQLSKYIESYSAKKEG